MHMVEDGLWMESWWLDFVIHLFWKMMFLDNLPIQRPLKFRFLNWFGFLYCCFILSKSSKLWSYHLNTRGEPRTDRSSESITVIEIVNLLPCCFFSLLFKAIVWTWSSLVFMRSTETARVLIWACTYITPCFPFQHLCMVSQFMRWGNKEIDITYRLQAQKTIWSILEDEK